MLSDTTPASFRSTSDKLRQAVDGSCGAQSSRFCSRQPGSANAVLRDVEISRMRYLLLCEKQPCMEGMSEIKCHGWGNDVPHKEEGYLTPLRDPPAYVDRGLNADWYKHFL
jgi:hypothetical protein